MLAANAFIPSLKGYDVGSSMPAMSRVGQRLEASRDFWIPKKNGPQTGVDPFHVPHINGKTRAWSGSEVRVAWPQVAGAQGAD